MVMVSVFNRGSGNITAIEGQSGKNTCLGVKADTGKLHSFYIGMNVCGSAYENGCVVNGMCAMGLWQLTE